MPIVPSSANVSARAPASAEAPDERGRERDAEGGRAAESPHEDSAGDEKHAGGGSRQPQREARPVRRQLPAEHENRWRRADERQKERG